MYEAYWVCVERVRVLRNVSTFPGRRKDQGFICSFPSHTTSQFPANRPNPKAITHENSYSRTCHVMISVSSYIPDPTRRIHNRTRDVQSNAVKSS